MSIGEKATLESLQAASASLANKDPELWGSAARALAQERLGWIDLPESSRAHLPALDALAAWSRSQKRTRFVLSGMGGSSLAPEVIATTFFSQSRTGSQAKGEAGTELVILDSTHPEDVRAALDPDPSNSLFIISSKSGETIETRSHLAAIQSRLAQENLPLREHVVVISDPQSPLASWAVENHLRFFPGEPTVGGRFSALSIFGLLPAVLIGVDCATLLDDAADMRKELVQSRADSPALALVQEILTWQPFINLPRAPLSDWIEQLIAESTGKAGKGIIPVIDPAAELTPEVRKSQSLPLGAAFYLWEWTTALLGFALEVNPFDQPNVASAKEATWQALNEKGSHRVSEIGSAEQLQIAIESSINTRGNPAPKYLALLAFIPMRNRDLHQSLLRIHDNLSLKLARKKIRVTSGFGPRYLHSTGQCHKGGPEIGSFIIITLDESDDYSIPGADYGFAELLMAQARGDFQTLNDLGKSVIHAHLTRAEFEKFSRALHATS